MLPLKYLIDNRELALVILSRWDYDARELQLMDRFRISSNAIYPFRAEGQLRFLRFAPLAEKAEADVLAELEFLSYLRGQGYPCLEPVPSRAGHLLESIDTPLGGYLATAFVGVPGRSLDPESMTEEDVFGWGQALGRLHRLSVGYQPLGQRRPDHTAQLAWIAQVLASFPEEELARQELELITAWLAKLPQDSTNYGLIHYDFETDNVFHDPTTGVFHAIDFDDAVYHWFMLDINAALDSYAEDAPAEKLEQSLAAFVAGYRTEHELSDQMLALMPGFRRCRKLYGYARILYAARERLTDEPDWMLKLRQRLDEHLRRRSVDFGKPI